MKIRPVHYCVTCIAMLVLNGCEPAENATERDNDVLDVAWQEPLVIATGNAHAGPWRINDTELHYVDDATVDLRDDGALSVAWVDNEQQELFFQRYDSHHTNNELIAQSEPPINISRSPGIFSWLPRILFTKNEQVYVLWQEIIFSGGSHGGEIFFSHSEDGGDSFTEPLNLSSTTAGAGKGRLTEEKWDNGSLNFILGHGGEIFVTWTEYEGGLQFRRSLDGGRRFHKAIQVNRNDQLPARAPTLALSPDGIIYLAWAVGEDKHADIHVAVSHDKGQSFSEPRVARESNSHADTPALAIDPAGNIHLVYAERPPGRQQFAVRYLALDEAGKTTAEPRDLSPHTDGEGGARAPAIGVDGENRVYVIWEHHPDATRFARGLGFAVSSDAGLTFTEPRMIPGSAPGSVTNNNDSSMAANGSLQGQLARKLAVNNKGEIAVVNSHFHLGEQSLVLLIRGKLRTPQQAEANP